MVNFKKTQVNVRSGRNTKLCLLLGIFPLIVFILLFAKLNLSFSRIVIDEEFLTSLDTETLESTLMTNIHVKRLKAEKPSNIYQRLRPLTQKLQKERQKNVESRIQNNKYEKEGGFLEKYLKTTPIRLTVVKPPLLNETFSDKTPNINSGSSTNKDRALKNSMKKRGKYRNGKYKTSRVPKDGSQKKNSSDDREMRIGTQIEMPIHIKNKHSSEKTKIQRNFKHILDSDYSNQGVEDNIVINDRDNHKNKNTQLRQSTISDGKTPYIEIPKTSDSYEEGKPIHGIVFEQEETETKAKVKGHGATMDVLSKNGVILKNNDLDSVVLTVEKDTTSNLLSSGTTNNISPDKGQTPSKNANKSSNHKQEIIKMPLGPFIEIPEQLQCNVTLKQNIMNLLPINYKHSNQKRDRISLQINHLPSSSKRINPEEVVKPKLIYWYGNKKNRNVPEGNSFFDQCKVKNCIATYDKSLATTADAVIFGNPGHLPLRPPFPKRSRDQIWAISMIETPPHSKSLKYYTDLFNWTLTYRHDSVIPTPYFKFKYFSNLQKLPNATEMNYAAGKTKKVAMFVSNCFLSSSGRLKYAKELAKYIDVDIFGRCGKFKCPKKSNSKCMEMVKKDYKFFLSFENSKCTDYMTEKVTKAYENDVIPILLGASADAYRQALPPESYILTEDFASPQHLAEYLHKLDKDNTLYNQYFRWKQQGGFVNIGTWCRVCGLLHEPNFPHIWYDDIEEWWRPENICIGKNNWSKT